MVGPTGYALTDFVETKVVQVRLFELVPNRAPQVPLYLFWSDNSASCVVYPLRSSAHAQGYDDGFAKVHYSPHYSPVDLKNALEIAEVIFVHWDENAQVVSK